VLIATHSTAPWYFVLVPLALVVIVGLLRWRGRGGGGPFGDGG
jgi:hypothetical protein